MAESSAAWLATDPGNGRTWTTPSQTSVTWATACVLADPTMIQAPSVILAGERDSSRNPHGSPVSSSLFRSTGRSTSVLLIGPPGSLCFHGTGSHEPGVGT